MEGIFRSVNLGHYDCCVSIRPRQRIDNQYETAAYGGQVRTIHNGARDRQRALLICPLERHGGQTFFHVAAARPRHLVPSIHEHGSHGLETRCDESCILTIIDPNDGTGGSQEHVEVAEYREIVFETWTERV